MARRAGSGDEPVVVAFLHESDQDLWARLVADHPRATFVALLDLPDLAAYARAFRSGADAICPRDAEPCEIVRVANAAARGWSMLPVDVWTGLAKFMRLSEPAMDIGSEHVTWIRALAEGTIVPVLAERTGCSEREMFRLLADLYRRMGAANRTGALVAAARWGLLDESG